MEALGSDSLVWPVGELYAQLALPVGSVETARGPHTRSNWVPIGWPRSRFCAGGWPFQLPSGYGFSGAESEASATAKARSLLEGGVTTFINLTQEGEIPVSGSYGVWMPRLQDIEMSLFGEDVRTRLRFDILCEMPDGWVTSDAELAVLLERMLNEIDDASRVLYVHCYGGHGRTGIVACSLLCLLYPAEVLRQIPDELRATWARTIIGRHFASSSVLASTQSKYPQEAWELAEGAVAIFNRFHAERINEDGGGFCRFPHSSRQIEQVVRVAQGVGPFAIGPFAKLSRNGNRASEPVLELFL